MDDLDNWFLANNFSIKKAQGPNGLCVLVTLAAWPFQALVDPNVEPGVLTIFRAKSASDNISLIADADGDQIGGKTFNPPDPDELRQVLGLVMGETTA